MSEVRPNTQDITGQRNNINRLSCIAVQELKLRFLDENRTWPLKIPLDSNTSTLFIITFFNVSTYLKSVSTSKSRVIYDLDTDLDTTTYKIIGVVGGPSTSLRRYLPPFRNLIFHCSWKRIHVNHPCPDTDSRVLVHCLKFQLTSKFVIFCRKRCLCYGKSDESAIFKNGLVELSSENKIWRAFTRAIPDLRRRSLGGQV